MNDDRSKMAGLDVISAVVLLVLGAAMTYVSYTMRIYNKSLVVSPGLFPMILGVLFMLLAALLGGLALRRGGRSAAAGLLSLSRLAACCSSPTFYRGVIVLGLIVVYVFLFGTIHFVAVTFLYLTGTFLYLRAMRPPYCLAVAAIAAAVVYAVFAYGFGIPVPNGSGWPFGFLLATGA